MSLLEKRVKRKKWDRSGVSEVVGNLLILAITVTLFSGIMFFVTSMPTPNEETYGDFSATIEFNTGIGGVTNTIMNVTHVSGQALENIETHIYVLIDGAPYTLYINDSSSPISNDLWTIGQTFRYDLNDLDGVVITTDSEIEVMIANHVNNTMVWSAVLNGVRGDYAPIIASRWIETVGSYQNPSEILYNDTTIRVYARIVDVDENINVTTAKVDLSDLGGSESAQLIGPSKGGIFQLESGTFDIPASISEGIKTLVFTVSDTTNKTSVAYFQIYLILQTTAGGGGGGWTGDGGDGPDGLWYSGVQGYNIFEREDFLENANNATPTTVFEHGQEGEILVASRILINSEGENHFEILDPSTKNVVYTGSFSNFDYINGYKMFNATFPTNSLNPGSFYYLSMAIKDNWVPVNNIFFATTSIYITDGGGFGDVTYETYSDSGFTIETNDFNSTDTIYIKITNENGLVWDSAGGDIIIRDFYGNIALKAEPIDGDTDAITYFIGQTGNVYKFAVNLERANGEPWIPGKSAYLLIYDMFKAGSESYILGTAVNITSPLNTFDIVAGSVGYSQGNHYGEGSLIFYRNDNKWTKEYVELWENTERSPESWGAHIVKVGDINGDDRNDIVAANWMENRGGADMGESGWELVVYYNNDGMWSKQILGSYDESDDIIDVAIGNVDYDYDLDIVASINDGEDLVLFRNKGYWVQEDLGALVTDLDFDVEKIEIADMFSTSGNEAFSNDVVISGGSYLYVLKNLDGYGRSWYTYPISSPSGTLPYEMGPFSEETQSGLITYQNYTVVGDGVYDSQDHEDLEEVMQYRWIEFQPATWNEEYTDVQTGGLCSYLTYLSPSNYVQTVYGQSIYVDDWSPLESITFEFVDIIEVTIEIDYISYSSGDDVGSLYFDDSGGYADIFIADLPTTSGVRNSANFTIAVSPDDLDAFLSMPIKFNNTLVGSVVDFYTWTFSVQVDEGYALEHTWEYELDARDSVPYLKFQTQVLNDAFKLFSLYVSSDNETFDFVSSFSGISLNDMYTLTDGIDISSYISSTTNQTWIKIVSGTTRTDGNADDDATKVSIWIMDVVKYFPASQYGTDVSDFHIEDVDNAYGNDIVIASDVEIDPPEGQGGGGGGGGTVVNYGVSIVYHTLSSWDASNPVQFSTGNTAVILTVDIGYLSSVNIGNEVVIATIDGVYIYSLTGTLLNSITNPPADIVTLIAADVDSDGDDDLVVAARGMVLLYTNWGGDLYPDSYLILDDTGGIIYSLDAGRVRT